MENNPNPSAFSGTGIPPENPYFRSNWDDPFQSTLSSIVSSPSYEPGFVSDDGIMIRELIGRLGSISESGPLSPQSCIVTANNTPLNSPPKFNLSPLFNFPGGLIGISNNSGINSHFNGELMGDSREGSSVSELNDVNSKKRKSIHKFPSSPVQDHKKKEVSSSKRSKTEEKKKSNNKESEKTDYIHVRARRGQATDTHSLAERVRREKISDRMKFLQDLVPGCNKVTGKASVLDEIINYVQSLQHQVEFLSIKLSNVNPGMNFNTEALLSTDMYEGRGSLRTMYQLEQNSAQALFPFGIPNLSEIPFPLNSLNATGMHQNPTLQLASFAGFCDPMTETIFKVLFKWALPKIKHNRDPVHYRMRI